MYAHVHKSMYTFVKTKMTAHLRYVQYTECKLYLKKVD